VRPAMKFGLPVRTQCLSLTDSETGRLNCEFYAQLPTRFRGRAPVRHIVAIPHPGGSHVFSLPILHTHSPSYFCRFQTLSARSTEPAGNCRVIRSPVPPLTNPFPLAGTRGLGRWATDPREPVTSQGTVACAGGSGECRSESSLAGRGARKRRKYVPAAS